MERVCEYCKELFTPKRVDMFYCSPSCRQMAYLKRKTNHNTLVKDLSGITYLTDNIDNGDQIQNVKDSKDFNSSNSATTIISKSENDNIVDPKDENILKPANNYNSKATEISKTYEYADKESVFIKELTDMANERDYVNDLSLLNYEGSEAAAWVNIRYRCLAECLLTFSEMKQIDLDDLKEVCNALTDLINSKYFKYLPVRYPYTLEIEQLRNNIKHICINSEEEQSINFKFREETKKKMIVTRWELAHYTPKKSFNQLNFKE